MPTPHVVTVNISVVNDMIHIDQPNPMPVHQPSRLVFRVVTDDWIFPPTERNPYLPNIQIFPNEDQVYPFSLPVKKSSTEVWVQDTHQGGTQLFAYKIFLESTLHGHTVVHDPGIKNEA